MHLTVFRLASAAAAALLLVALPGCVAKTLVDVATLPVKVASKGVDLATTSQSEADEKRGREIRKREAELARLEKRYTEQRYDCERGDARACEDARATYTQIQALLPSIPVEPDR